MDTKFYRSLFNLSMKHRIEFDPDTQMVEIETYIKAIGACNEFNPVSVLGMIKKIDSIIPRAFYNEGNPNNGKRLWKIDIGCDGSEVLYLTVCAKAGGKDKTLSKDIPELISMIESIAKTARADEITHEEEEEYPEYKEIKFRFWWD